LISQLRLDMKKCDFLTFYRKKSNFLKHVMIMLNNKHDHPPQETGYLVTSAKWRERQGGRELIRLKYEQKERKAKLVKLNKETIERYTESKENREKR